MIETLIRLAWLLLALLPFLLLALLNTKANLKRSCRDRQFPMPVLTLLYSVVLMVFLDWISKWILMLVQLIADLLVQAGAWLSQIFDGLLSGPGGAVEELGAMLSSLLQTVDPAYILLFMGNAILLLAHILIKRILISVFQVVFRSGGSFHDLCVEPFYEKDADGAVSCVHCTVDLDSRSGCEGANRKVKGTLHWVSAADGVPFEARLYDTLLKSDEGIGEDAEGAEEPVVDKKDFISRLNPNSLQTLRGYMEPSLQSAAVSDTFQFLRVGYFCKDPDSTDALPVFNRVVGLKDSFKIAKA